MKNKLIIGTLIAVLLIGGLYAWSQGAPSEPNVDENSSNTAQNTDTQPQTGLEFFDDYPEGTIKIDPSQIIAGTDKASDHAPLLADSSHGLARDSYAIVASRAYADWTQYYESYLPHFTDELPTAMGESVAQYYAQRYQTELADADQYCATFASGGILYDQPFEKQKYYFSDYTSRLVGDYLVVGFHTEAYAGGAHP
ncbi:hypothetical protein IJJ12_02200, partial [bacterium]|nr:hypothetical protein [bacterium]